MKCGFIGYGKMGKVIVRSMLNDGSLDQGQVIIFNRTAERLDSLKTEYPSITVVSSPIDVAVQSDMLFICTSSGAVVEVLDEIAGSLLPNTHLITITGALRMSDLERQFSGPITKAMPSVTLSSGRGITLACHNNKVDSRAKDAFNALFARSSKVKIVREEQLEVAADLTSTAPALMTLMMEKWVESAGKKGKFSKEESMIMLLETMLGTALMLTDGDVSPEELKSMVATKGGITEQGMLFLDQNLPVLYDGLFQATQNKRDEVVKKIMADSMVDLDTETS